MTHILFKEYPEGFVKEKRCFKEHCGRHGLSGVFPQSPDDVETSGIPHEENQVYSKLRSLLIIYGTVFCAYFVDKFEFPFSAPSIIPLMEPLFEAVLSVYL